MADGAGAARAGTIDSRRGDGRRRLAQKARDDAGTTVSKIVRGAGERTGARRNSTGQAECFAGEHRGEEIRGCAKRALEQRVERAGDRLGADSGFVRKTRRDDIRDGSRVEELPGP